MGRSSSSGKRAARSSWRPCRRPPSSWPSAALARELGLKAEGLAVADVVTVADTLPRVTKEVDAQAVVVGDPRRRAIAELLVGAPLERSSAKRAARWSAYGKPDEAGERS
jgi:hypothetical protein